LEPNALLGVWFQKLKHFSVEKLAKGQSVNSGKDKNNARIIDENLKRAFDQTLEEGIPDRFKNLLDQLKQQDAERGSQR
jgi:hypothetical protein